jgi:phage terminase large subunit-like protein
MNLFRRPDYQSETTQFITQLKANKPKLESEQLAGRALLWDKAINRNDQSDIQAGQVAQKAYVYGSR